MRIYVAGPMTGLPEYNYPAFRAAAAQLRARGYEVENPAEPGQVEGWSWADYMRRALGQLITCDGIALLPGWSTSSGARVENLVATCLDMETRTLDGWLDDDEAVA